MLVDCRVYVAGRFSVVPGGGGGGAGGHLLVSCVPMREQKNDEKG